MTKKKEEAPEISEITSELKEMGSNLKKIFDRVVESEKAQKIKSKTQDALETMTKEAKKVGDDFKSGALERDARKGIYNTLKGLNKKLKEYAREEKAKR